MLDVRLPIGALFFILGIMIAAWGYTHPPAAAFITTMGQVPINFDIIWGIFMTLFGMVMYSLAKLGHVSEMEKAVAAQKLVVAAPVEGAQVVAVEKVIEVEKPAE